MGLHHIGSLETTHHLATAVEHRPSATSARNGFVVLVSGISKGEIVHGGLTARHHTQGTIQGIGDACGGLDIAGHHRGRRQWVEHGTLWDDDLNGL